MGVRCLVVERAPGARGQAQGRMGTGTEKVAFEKRPTLAALRAASTQPALPFDAAQPETLTLDTVPAEENVTIAREMSSASATHALALPMTVPIAACTDPCDGCSGMFW